MSSRALCEEVKGHMENCVTCYGVNMSWSQKSNSVLCSLPESFDQRAEPLDEHQYQL